MSIPVASIERYAGALGQVLCDQELVQAKQTLRIYFDTRDIRDALLGLESFYDDAGRFNRRQFESPRTLVQSLMAAGWLGTISMLTPHQAELVALLQLGFGRNARPPFAKQAAVFWKDAGVLREEKGLPESLQSLSDDEIAAIVREQSGRAATFFKAVQSITGPWQARLRTWTQRHILSFEPSTEDFGALVASPLFQELRSGFSEVRPESLAANFADAAALTILSNRIQDFRDGLVNDFPCIYATRVFESVIARTGRHQWFEVRLASGVVASSIRSTEYFLLRAIHSPVSERLASLDPTELRRLYDELSSVLTAADGDYVRKYAAGADSALSTLIRELTSLEFFDRVWLPYAALDDTPKVLRHLTDADVRREVTAEIHRVQHELHINAARYRTAAQLSERLRFVYERLSAERGQLLPPGADVIALLGLAPFGLKPDLQDEVCTLVHGLLASDAPTLGKVIDLYLRVRDERVGSEISTVVAAVLWIAGLDDLIMGLDRESDGELSESLEILFAAAMSRSGRGPGEVRARIARLEHRYTAMSKCGEKGDLAIGLAYLYGRLALSMRHEPERVTRDELLKRAVHYASSAALDVDHEARRAYALNQSLYYLLQTESADATQMRKAADRLMSCQNSSSWQYRFDDTMAFYFYWRSNALLDRSERVATLQLARRWIERAVTQGHFDPEVMMHRAMIQMRLDESAS